jgi:hypothetical protein
LTRKAIILVLIILTACTGTPQGLSQESIQETAAVMAQTIIAETAAALPTDTAIPATATITPTETLLPTATETLIPTLPPPPTVTPTVDLTQLLRFYVLREDGDGPVGCGDTPIALYSGYYKSDDVLTDIRLAMTALLANKSLYIGSFLNPISKSSLQVGDVRWVDSNIYVELVGNLVRGDERCVWNQLLTQLQYTARGAAQGNTINVRINGGPVKDYLSDG